ASRPHATIASIPFIVTSTVLLLARLESAAELVGERAEPLRRRNIRALGILTHFVGLARVQDRFAAEANAPTGRVDLENDDLDVGTDWKRLRDVGFPGDAGLTQRHEACTPGRQKDEHAELLVTLDLAGETRARHDRGLRR